MRFILALLLTITSLYAGTGAIPSGHNIKLLKVNLRFKNTDTKIMTNDSDDPTVVAKDAEVGSLYIRSTTGVLYQKQDSGSSTNWLPLVIGPSGSGTDECVSRWDGTGTTLLQDSVFCITDAGVGTGLTALTVDNITLDGAAITSDTGELEISDDLVVQGDFTVNGTQTTVNSTTLDVAAANVTVNDGGNEASADLSDAGLIVEISDATDAVIGFDSTLASKFKIGESGAESEIVSVDAAQDLLNKTQLQVDNLTLDADTISSDGDIILDPDVATGKVVLNNELTDKFLYLNASNEIVSQDIDVSTDLGTASNGELLVGNGTGYSISTLTGTANQVNVTNGSGSITLSTPQDIAAASSPSFTGLTVSGLNPSEYVITDGSSALSTVATIPAADGGTGLDGSSAANGELLIGNGTGYSLSTITGTADQVDVTNASGSITLSTPQSIATTSSPEFTGLTLSGLTDTGILYNNSGVITDDASFFSYDDATRALDLNGIFNIDNLSLNTNTLSTSNVNGDLILEPNGLGITQVNSDLVVNDTGYLGLASGTTAQRPTATAGRTRFNTDLSSVEVADGTDWNKLSQRDGNLNIYHRNDFEDTTIGSSYVSCLDGGTVGAGSPVTSLGSIETTNELDGAQSYKFTQPASGAGYYCLTTISGIDTRIDVPPYGQSTRTSFVMQTSYDGNSGDMSLFLWDDTNSKVMEDADGNDIFLDLLSGTTQTRITLDTQATEQLRWGVIINTANSGAVLVVDNLEITANPDKNISIFASSDWESYTPIITGFGTVSSLTASWREDGPDLLVYVWFTAGSVSSTDATVSLPNNELIRQVNGANTEVVGTYTRGNTSTFNSGKMLKYITGSDSVVYFGQTENQSSSTENPLDVAQGTDIGGGSGISFEFRIPIKGWSDKEDNVVVANTDQALDRKSWYSSSSTTVPTSSWATINMNAEDSNNVGNRISYSSSILTVSESNFYNISSMITLNDAGGTSSGYGRLRNTTDGDDVIYSEEAYTSGRPLPIILSKTVYLEAGKNYEFQALHNTGSDQVNITGEGRTYFSIDYNPSFREIVSAYLDESKTAVKYNRDAAQSIANDTFEAVEWDAEELDDNDNFSVSTGVITFNTSGLYYVQPSPSFASNSTGFRSSKVVLNGSDTDLSTYVHPVSGQITKLSYGGLLNINAGDELQVQVYQNSGGSLGLVVGGTAKTTLSIHRIR